MGDDRQELLRGAVQPGHAVVHAELGHRRRHLDADRAGDRHARRLRLLAPQIRRQRAPVQHHPVDALHAADRRGDPAVPDGQGDRPAGQLSRPDPALCRVLAAAGGVDPDRLLRRDPAGDRRGGDDRRRHPHPGAVAGDPADRAAGHGDRRAVRSAVHLERIPGGALRHRFAPVPDDLAGRRDAGQRAAADRLEHRRRGRHRHRRARS